MVGFQKAVKRMDGLYRGKSTNFRKDKKSRSTEIAHGAQLVYQICCNLLKLKGINFLNGFQIGKTIHNKKNYKFMISKSVMS